MRLVTIDDTFNQDDANTIEMTSTEARALFDLLPDDSNHAPLANELDEAQGDARSTGSPMHIVLRIVP